MESFKRYLDGLGNDYRSVSFEAKQRLLKSAEKAWEEWHEAHG